MTIVAMCRFAREQLASGTQAPTTITFPQQQRQSLLRSWRHLSSLAGRQRASTGQWKIPTAMWCSQCRGFPMTLGQSTFGDLHSWRCSSRDGGRQEVCNIYVLLSGDLCENWRLRKWTDAATNSPEKACFQCRCPISLEFFGRLFAWSGHLTQQL